jgi:hypothetical protein
MLRFFHTIRKKLIEQENVRKYLLYAIGEILLVVIGIFRPVRDNLRVETMYSPNPHRVVRYGICRNPDMTTNHMAYLRHTGPCMLSAFYRYVVPTGQNPSAKSFNP